MARHGLRGWAARPSSEGLRRAGDGKGLGAQTVIAVAAAAGLQTGAADALRMAVRGAGADAAERRLKGKDRSGGTA